MGSLLQNKWKEMKQEWSEMEGHERILTAWELCNLGATIALPFILLFVFVSSAPELPSASTLLILIGIGILYGSSIVFQGPIMAHIEPSEYKKYN